MVASKSTFEQVQQIVVEHLGVDADKVTEGASFVNDLGADSLDAVELLMVFEEEFNIEIADEDAESVIALGTIGDAVKYIDRRGGR